MNYGCRWGQPHDLTTLGQNPQKIVEKCKLCHKVFRWNKGYKSRIANKEYLKAHIRNFAQEYGATKRTFNKIYHPEKCVINL